LVQENASLCGKLSTVHSQLNAADIDQKSQRETILRLMNDQQNFTQFHLEMDNIRVVCIARSQFHV